MERINQRTNHLLGQNIKRLRIEHQLRNRDIIAWLQIRGIEISSSTYSKVEMGLNNPSVDLIIALADIITAISMSFLDQSIKRERRHRQYLHSRFLLFTICN